MYLSSITVRPKEHPDHSLVRLPICFLLFLVFFLLFPGLFPGLLLLTALGQFCLLVPAFSSCYHMYEPHA